ncbi:MAG TPA: hypothetical protein VMS12_06490, partial [Thermoanaerobaculia bacterium]|nr:hypothetical protein [Thermoanaerobaculia bacterium]
LFYAGGDRSVMAVTVHGGSAFEVGAPVRLFQLPEGASVMDATSDGERFLLSVWTEEPPAAVFEAVLNWESLVTKRLAEHNR